MLRKILKYQQLCYVSVYSPKLHHSRKYYSAVHKMFPPTRRFLHNGTFFPFVPALHRLVGQLSSAPSTGSCKEFPSIRSLGNQLSLRSAILCVLP